MSLPLKAEGEFALARQNLEMAVNIKGHWVGDHDLFAMLADTAVRQSDVEALQLYAPLAEEAAIRYNHALYQAVANRAFGVLHLHTGEHDQSAVRLNTALEAFQKMKTRWQIGRTLYHLGELELMRGNRMEGRRRLNEALVEFTHLGAKPDETHTRQALDGIG